MITEHRYTLEKGSKKYLCPSCNKKTLVLYIDTATDYYLPNQYGRCDRESKCGYWLDPYKDGYVQSKKRQTRYEHAADLKRRKSIHKKGTRQSEPVFFDFETFKQTLQAERYESNTFVQNLLANVPYPLEVEAVNKVIELYRLGTVATGGMTGALTLPYIDKDQNVRAVQVKQFDKDNHTTKTSFLHSIVANYHTLNKKPLPDWLGAYTAQEKRVTCLFGEHLLCQYKTNPVALVEAPKTAIYGTLYFGTPQSPDDFVWIAVYNKSSFSFDKLKVLQGRKVYVFPDLSKDGSTFTEWESKAKEYEMRLQGTSFVMSDLLERLATRKQKEEGADIADILIQMDWRLFRGRNRQIQQLRTVLALLKEYEPQLGITNDMIANPLNYERDIRGIYRTMHQMGYYDFENKY